MVRAGAEWCYANQRVLWEMLRASLESDATDTGYQRPRRRRDWIEDALAPPRDDLDPNTYRRIAAALTLFFGIDPIIVMQTMAELPAEDTVDTLVWGAIALVDAAMNEHSQVRAG
jgi:hypothetical protein